MRRPMVSTRGKLSTEVPQLSIPRHWLCSSVNDCEKAVGSKHSTEAWECQRPLCPMNARSRCNECIGRSQCHLFNLASNPIQARMISIGEVFALLKHGL